MKRAICPFDTVLAATAAAAGARALVSADRRFGSLPVRYLDPAAPDFERELRHV